MPLEVLCCLTSLEQTGDVGGLSTEGVKWPWMMSGRRCDPRPLSSKRYETLYE